MRKAPFACWLPGVSRGTVALLLSTPIAVPVACAAGFSGSAVVAHGGATIGSSGNTQTITISAKTPVTTIDWTPTDTAIGGGAIDFLPAGQTVSFVGAAGTGFYTVLNRIIPNDLTRTVAFNGAVTSAANARVWFYSPGGLLIGSTATFNVGGLVLTTSDPVIDAKGNFITTTSGAEEFSFAGVAGSTSAITIQPGASIKALSSGQSNYIVAIAPQIDQGGTISVAGSVALVAAESASFAVDSHGLFNITVSAGTTVADNTFVHTGSTGGPNTDPSGSYQRVYMVAVPKNNAVSMAIAAGGSIGFAVADAAKVDGNEIVLSAGSNIADTGSGNPVVAGRAGSGAASLTVGGGNYTSNTYAVSTDAAAVTDPALSMSFASGLTVIARNAEVFASAGTLSVGGNLAVTADSSSDGATQSAYVGAAAGTRLAVGANAAALGVNGDLTATSNDALAGTGGNALLQANGSVTVAGNALVSATGSWGSGAANDGSVATRGGFATVSVNAGELNIGGKLTVDANGDATGSYAALTSPGQNDGATASGGLAFLMVSGPSAMLTAGKGIAVEANAISGIDGYNVGGQATGGTALISAELGGTIGVGVSGAIVASASATAANMTLPEAYYGTGGDAIGGTAQVIAVAGTITVAGVEGISAYADATGGVSPAYSGNGGNATGGTALIGTLGASGAITTNTSGSTGSSQFASVSSATGTGGNAKGYGTQGGNATGGTATVQVTGANQSITLDHGNDLIIEADAIGGDGEGSGGGSAVAGTAQLLAGGGSIAITNTSLLVSAIAVGGPDQAGSGGNATAGTVRLAATGGGALNADVTMSLDAFADGGVGSGNGGNALGGNIFIDMSNNAFNFAGTAHANLDAGFIAGTGNTAGTAASAGGVLVTNLGTFALGGSLNLIDNTPLYVQADGSIDVSGSITASGSGAYVHLWADDLGSGTGTVTLASGALNLPGSQIDIYYNPASLGTPTDFTAGVKAGTATAYQLVDNIDQLQLVGSTLSQNFALGKNIDASATQGWNDGAGFVPIGTYGNGFTGKFDGLGHTIINLMINDIHSDSGLFGALGAGTGAQIIVRNVGLIDPQITGASYVGGLVGGVALYNTTVADNISISNSYISGGAVSGVDYVGGFVGIVNYGSNVTFTKVHSDTAVAGSGSFVGGLVGFASGATITNAFATGAVTDVVNGASAVGGLIGYMPGGGTLSDVYATGNVTAGSGSAYVGGLVGMAEAGISISHAYATGNVVTGADSTAVGGLVGSNSGVISESWASGSVQTTGGSNVGGFAGYNGGTISNSYWDSYSTGQSAGIGTDGGTTTNLNAVTSNPEQTDSENYAFGSEAYGNFTPGNWVYDNDDTRPVGTWEIPVAQFGVANILSAHQVQLIDLNLAGNYTVTQNIDLRGTGGTTDIWDTGGFMPLGGELSDPPFTGVLEGGGHVLSNLTMAPGAEISDVGLIQQNYGTIRNLGLSNIAITEGELDLPVGFYGHTGALAGVNAGQISNSFATGTITVNQASSSTAVGGLVGLNSDGTSGGTIGSVTQSYATVAISGAQAAGGLVGDNEGTIVGSYANGAVSGTLAGGLVGQSTNATGPTVTSSYWDTQMTGQSGGCGSTGYSGACSGALGLTTAQTLQSASFAGFTIDTTGGQGLAWRQYQGQTTPLLEAFLTPISVQPGSLTVQYDAQTPDVGVTTYGAQPSLTFGTAQVAGLTKNAGTVDLTYAGGLYSNQLGYDFVPSTTPGTLTITPAPLTLAASSDTRVYNATTGSTGAVLASGLYGEDSVTSLSQSFTSPNALGTNGSTLAVDSGYVIEDGNGGRNYSVTLQSAQGTITPAALTLAAVTDSRSYNATTGSTGAVKVSGLFGMDSVTSLTQSFTSANVMGINGSTLAVNPGYVVNDGNDGGNYSITLRTAQGTISPAALAVIYAANSASAIYGTTISGLSGAISAIGLQGADTLASVTAVSSSFATAATSTSNVGSYAITGSGLSGNSGNYSFSFAQAAGNASALTIVPRALTLTANPLSRIYASANPTSDTATATPATATTGLVNGDTIGMETVTTPATPGSNVGTYALDGSAAQFSAGLATNYTITYAANATGLSITPAAATVTYSASPLSSIYGNGLTGLSGTESVSGLVNGDTLDSITSGTASFATAATSASNVGTYAVIGSGLSDNSVNYSVSFVQAPGNATALTIVQRALTLTANPLSRIYGSANPISDSVTPAPATVSSGLVNGDSVASETVSSPATSGSGVGSYALDGSAAQFGAGLASNYAITYAANAAGLTITPAALTLTYTAAPGTSIYGQVPAGLTGSTALAGLVNGDTAAGVTGGTALWTSPATAASNVGTYAIAGSGIALASADYTLTSLQAPGNATALTVNPAALAIVYTASLASRAYGAANPALSGMETATGLVNGDTLAGVTSGAAGFTTAATATANVGNYAVIGSGLAGSSSNYTYSFAQAAGNATALAIAPAAATIIYTANPLSAIYGNMPSGTSGATGASGLVNGDTISSVTSGTAGFATTATGLSNVGSYAITGSGLAGNSGNYSFSFVQAAGNATALTIVQRALTLTADPISRIYGGIAVTTDTATAGAATATTGLVNGDSVSSETVTSPATSGSGVGSYALNGSAAQFGSGAASNYAITYVTNDVGLSITPAALTLTYAASPAGSTYGQTPTGLTGSAVLTGLVNNDSAESVTSGTALWSSPATATSNVGSYAIDGSGIGLTSANYMLTSVQAPGNATALTVNPATLSITYTANPASRIYGAGNPALSGTETVTGLANGDTLGGVTSGAATYTTTATTAANVGSYAITGGGLTGTSANYTFGFVQAPANATALAITPAAVTITYTANPLSSIYGNVPAGLTGTESAAGLVNGDTLAGITSGSAGYATAATSASNVGIYAVTGSGLAADSGNYSFSFVQAAGNAMALTIVPRSITVTANPQARQVGAADPLFTYVVTGPGGSGTPGLVNGDSLTGQLASTATITSPAGVYDIVQGTLAASANYRLTYVGNIVTLGFAVGPIADVTNAIEANLPDQPGLDTPDERRKRAEAALAALAAASGGLHPPQITQSMINDHLVTTPPPVTEPVTSNGNSSLWGHRAP